MPLFAYEGNWRRMVLGLKQYPDRDLLRQLAARMESIFFRKSKDLFPDLIVPIPNRWLSSNNLPAYWARIVSGILKIPLAHLLRTRKAQHKQRGLTKRRRYENMSEAFAVRDALHAKKVLLIDDVYTTGATCNAAATCLKQHGAVQVGAVTLAYRPRQIVEGV
jgi:predicted amidophosphoribosyltransferase